MSEGTSLSQVLDQVSKDKNIERKVLVEALEQAILTAAKRAFGEEREMEAKFNEATGRVDLFQIIIVADPVTKPAKEITLEEAKQFNLQADVGRRAAVPDLLRREGSGARPRSRTPSTGPCSSSTGRGRPSVASPPRPPSRSSCSASARPSARTSSTSTRTGRAS